jgi:hypothetical protein
VSQFVAGREKFLKCDFFNYIKIENHKKWESEKKIRKGKKISHIIYAVYCTAYLPLPQYIRPEKAHQSHTPPYEKYIDFFVKL